MWFKKKAYIDDYNSNTAVDGRDWRTTNRGQNWPVSQTLPSAADAGNYFYLPALGYYGSGYLYSVGISGQYWSSSAYSRFQFTPAAFCLVFTSSTVVVTYSGRFGGFRVDGFK